MKANDNRSTAIKKSVKKIKKSVRFAQKWVKRLNARASLRYASMRMAFAALTRDYRTRLLAGTVERPHYGYCVYNAAQLARKLGHTRISVLEFGVAGGNGLVNLEFHAAEVTKLLGVAVDIYGFDTGTGLPAPLDYRDLPYYWKQGFYAMDQDRLKSRLKSATLVLGNIGETVQRFAETHRPAPIAAILFDLDFYSSTKASFAVFDIPREYLLPRIFCYFDDVIGRETELYSNYTGALLAISEFNQSHQDKKIDRARYLLAKPVQTSWYRQIYVFHDFSHPAYNTFIGQDHRQISLR